MMTCEPVFDAISFCARCKACYSAVLKAGGKSCMRLLGATVGAKTLPGIVRKACFRRQNPSSSLGYVTWEHGIDW